MGSFHQKRFRYKRWSLSLPDLRRTHPLLRIVFQGLGRLEAEQECRRLELYQAQFQAALQEGEAAARTQSMLSHKLGLAAGLAAAILLG